jgi:hypothetical protein
MKIRHRWVVLIMCCGTTLLGSSCATDIRDAIVSGALDFVSGNTSSLLSSLFPAFPA